MFQEPNNTGATKDAGTPPSPKENAKVELDLDDAPFLEDEEPEPEPDSKTPPKKPGEEIPDSDPGDADGKKRLGKKKKAIIAGGVAGLLLVTGITLKLFAFSGGPQAPEPGPEPEKVLAEPKALPQAPVPQFMLQWEPFWVELKDTEGAIRFLTLRFSIPTDNPVLVAEMNAKMLTLRDALFYYLRNQPILSLRDEAKVQVFKGDLLTVINEHLSGSKASEILIQDYLVQ